MLVSEVGSNRHDCGPVHGHLAFTFLRQSNYRCRNWCFHNFIIIRWFRRRVNNLALFLLCLERLYLLLVNNSLVLIHSSLHDPTNSTCWLLVLLFLLPPVQYIVKFDIVITDYFYLAMNRVGLHICGWVSQSHAEGRKKERVQRESEGQVCSCVVLPG